MKRFYIIISTLLLLSLPAMSQEVGGSAVVNRPTVDARVVADTTAAIIHSEPIADVMPAEATGETDGADFNLPAMDYRGHIMPLSSHTYYYAGWYPWFLHKGLNLSLSASVFAGFGKNAYHGVGFSESISAMYATQLTPRLSLAAGGYFTNVNWAHSNFHDAGLSAVLSYRFNDHWEAFAYAQKSLVDKRRPLPLYDISNIGDRIGIGAAYHFSPSFMISVSVEKRDYPQFGPMPMDFRGGIAGSSWNDMLPGFGGY